MEIKYKLFPYPVLSEYLNDYKKSSFSVEIIVRKEGKNIYFKEIYNLENKELEQLIKEKRAKVISHYECSKTGLRKVETLTSEENEFCIHESKLNGKLQICTFIIAVDNILDFFSDDFHDDFRGYTFKFDQGCILAIAKELDYDIDKQIDEFSNTKSIFSVQNNLDKGENNLLVDYNRNKIVVKVPTKAYAVYKNLSSEYELRDLLNSMVIVPSLVYVLEEVSKRDSDERYDLFSSYGWYKSLEKRLKEWFNISIEDDNFNDYNLLEIAQKLLDNPIINGFNRLLKATDLDDLEE